MKTKKIILLSLTLFSLSLLFDSCVKQEFDDPPSNCDDIDIEATFSIHDLKSLFTGDTTRLDDSVIVKGYVTSTDQYGNFYKELVIQDTTDAICIMIDASYLFTKFPVGQKVFIKCGNLLLGNDDGAIKLGSTYTEYGITNFGRIQGEPVIDEHIIKTCDNSPVEPREVTINQIDDGLLYKLIKIDSVQFANSELGTTWADGINLESVNHILKDENNNSIIVRTSGYASFARDTIPEGSGSIVGILGKFDSDYQIYIRNTDDVDMNNERFTEPIFKDFEDGDIYSGGWINEIVVGRPWELGTIGGNYAQCKSWDGSTNIETESWYISPELNLSEYSEPFVSFENAYNYTGDPLEVKYSTDYSGSGDPNNATWTDLSPNLSTGSWNWVNSGELSLPSENNIYVAFVYFGTDSDGSTWEVDDILIDDAAKK